MLDFQKVIVNEPSVDDSIQILKGIRKAYEEHHRLVISDAALEAAAHLSARYVTERFLPDKAIDLIDEASSRVRMYKSPAAQTFKELMVELKDVKALRTEAVQKGQNDDVMELSNRESDLKTRIEKLRTGWDRATSPVVSPDDIAELVSMWTGVPVMQLATEESERLLHMEEEMNRTIIGQEEAIKTIAKAVRRGRAGLKDPRRPIGSFMFLGPTGVGKTALTRALASFLFGSEDALIQIDMSEFMERHNVSRLVGAPPGYVGYDEGGQLTEAVRRRPYRVILFDEIEKAHPDVWNALLQILDDGRLTDGQGRVVDFRNTVLIMTSNLGTEFVRQNGSLGFLQKADSPEDRQAHEKIEKALKSTFRPEFLNRIDEIIMFSALNTEQMVQIVDLQMKEVYTRLEEHGLKVEMSQKARDWLATEGYDPSFGARPLKRAIQRELQDPLALKILAGRREAGHQEARADADRRAQGGDPGLHLGRLLCVGVEVVHRARDLLGAGGRHPGRAAGKRRKAKHRGQRKRSFHRCLLLSSNLDLMSVAAVTAR